MTDTTGTSPTLVIEARPESMVARLASLWRYRGFYGFLFEELTLRRARGTLLGVWGLLLAHFAVRGLMHEAALQANEDPDRLSFSHAVHVLRRKIPHFAALSPSGRACPARRC